MLPPEFTWLDAVDAPAALVDASGELLVWNTAGRSRLGAPRSLDHAATWAEGSLLALARAVACGECAPRTVTAVLTPSSAEATLRVARIGTERAIVVFRELGLPTAAAPLGLVPGALEPAADDDEPTFVVARGGAGPARGEPAPVVGSGEVEASRPEAPPRALAGSSRRARLDLGPLPMTDERPPAPVVDLHRVRTAQRARQAPPLAPPAPRMSPVLTAWGLPFLMHDRERVIEANEAAAQLLGARDAAALRDMPLVALAPALLDGGALDASQLIAEACAAAVAGHHVALWTVQRLDGSRVPVEVSVTALRAQGQELLLSVWQDRGSEHAFREGARERERLALALARSIRPLLSRSDVDGAIREALATLGVAVGADRCFVIVLREDAETGALETAHRIAWAADGIVEPPPVPMSYDRARSAPVRWLKVLKAGGVLAGRVSDFPADERARLERYEVRSLAMVPIRLDGRLLGFVGLDACTSERTWTASEVEILRGMADSFAGAFARQATDRLLAESRDRYHAAMRGTDIAVWEIDVFDSRVVHADGFDRLLGLRADEIPRTAREFFRMVHPDDQPALRDALDRQLGGTDERMDVEVRLRRGDGVWNWTLLRGRVSRRGHDGVAERVLGTVLDIEQRRRLDEQVRVAREVADAAGAVKSRFLANMSHEVRTPLNAVLGLSTLLLDEPLTAPQRELVDTVRTHGEHLLAMLNQVLDVSRLDGGPVQLAAQPVSLLALLDDVRARFAAAAAAKRLDLHVAVDEALPLAVLGDPSRLRHLLGSLVDNAVKFTERGRVVVRARAGAAPGTVCFSVQDTGPGIPPERVAGLFGPFVLVDDSDARRHGGVGLGLTLAHRLAELMGGVLEVETAPSGTRVWVDLALPQAVEDAASDGGVRLPGELRVLVVEDNVVNQKVAVGLLGSLGCSATVSDCGQAALDTVSHEAFDVVLMDIQMPDMDGLETTRRIRERVGDHTHPWIIAVTAAAQAEDRQRGLDSGMNDYLAKPVRREDLERALRRAVRGGAR